MKDLKEIYAIYVHLMRIQKSFSSIPYDRKNYEVLIRVINAVNAKYNTAFCYAMCDLLRQWYTKKFSCMEPDEIPRYYSELWHFHKSWIEKEITEAEWEKITKEAIVLSNNHETAVSQGMISAIVYDLDYVSRNE